MLIHSYQEKCAKLQIELNHYTIDEVMDYLDGEHQKQQTIDFIKFSREWIASTTIKGASNYTSALNALIRFIGEEELDVNLITLDFLEKFKAFLNKEREERTKKLIAQGKRVPSNRSLSQGFEWADYSKEDAICVYIKYNQQVNGYDVSAICLVDTLYNEFYSTYNSATIKGHGFIHF